MRETFSSIFQKNSGQPISYEGQFVCPIFVKKIEADKSIFQVVRVSADMSKSVGLRLQKRGQIYFLWTEKGTDLFSFALLS